MRMLCIVQLLVQAFFPMHTAAAKSEACRTWVMHIQPSMLVDMVSYCIMDSAWFS